MIAVRLWRLFLISYEECDLTPIPTLWARRGSTFCIAMAAKQYGSETGFSQNAFQIRKLTTAGIIIGVLQ